MAQILAYDTAKGRRWKVRYATPSGKDTTKRGFVTKRDATAFLNSLEVSKAKGEYVAPSGGRELVGDLYERWIMLKGTLKPSTLHSLRTAWKVHVEPVWGDRRIGSIQKSEVQAWVTGMHVQGGKSATVVLRAHGILAGVLDLAVDDGLIAANRARGVDLPRKGKGHHAYLTWEQVLALADAAGTHGDLVLFLATTGLRWGEAVALRGKHIDRPRRRVRVEQSAAQIGNELVVGAPKTHERRTVPITPSMLARMPLFMPEALVWPSSIGEMRKRPRHKTGWWDRAVERCMEADPLFPRVTPHDMRHTAASLAVSAGANVKALQRMLGHASAAMTLDQYADLFDDDLDAVADGLENFWVKNGSKRV
ncbi:tyrosine-type recombinase/integrase [Pseudoclavibacter alba]|uniref:tyrosine-type recombinase/integrase n=1 Tax=Pseudoclavibacter albus TaxID=272241 RepID=UPI0019D21518|nr:site-specific integrase [Pseudoclavibacter alba]MBN6777393.1 tyrosine-type recombinase/integrase [Pseudoclavibacter alba]